MNWRFSLTNTNNHVSNREVSQLPLPEIDTISKDLYNSIVSEVKSIGEGIDDSLISIEALVFSIYGFSRKEARKVLEMRQTPMKEAQEIVNALQDN
jgi:hypothetical protein